MLRLRHLAHVQRVAAGESRRCVEMPGSQQEMGDCEKGEIVERLSILEFLDYKTN